MAVIAIDLFCGIGGLTRGILNSGINVVAGVDLDETCEFAYTNNNIRRDNLENVEFINKSVSELGQELVNYYGENDVKILMGCAPCQPFSNHQKNKLSSETHEKWDLLYSFINQISILTPDIVSMENVANLANKKIFEEFCDFLVKNNYNVNYQIIDAADYGVPQRRKRLLLLASKIGSIEFIKKTHVDKKVTVRDAIGHLPEINAGANNLLDNMHTSSNLNKLNQRRIKASTPGGTWRDWPKNLLPECYKKESGATYTSVYGRMKWDKIAPTLTTQFTTYGTGRFGHPQQNRALSLREGAILQTFPIDYKFYEKHLNITRATISRHIGNAVPVRLGEVIGESIIKHLIEFKIWNN